MSAENPAQKTLKKDDFKVQLEVFEGPFDLLLSLIGEEKIEIFDVSISEITSAYLDYLNKMQELDLEISSEFMEVAAMLIKMKSVEICAKSYEEAVESALSELGVTIEEVEITRLEDAVKGFLGIGAKDCRIKVTVVNMPIKRAEWFLSQVLEKMGIDGKVETVMDSEGLMKVDIIGDCAGVLIGRRGETLDALQYLVGLVVNRGTEKYIRVSLDTENYRQKREETLVNLAHKLASRVVKYRRSLTLEPMNPYERRIIHAALQVKEFISTASIGDEPGRRVIITYRDRRS